MAILFHSRPMTVSVLKDTPVVPGRIRLEELQGQALLVTGVDADPRTREQWQPTLSDRHHLYVMGDRLTEITVQGLAFAEHCDANPQSEEGRGLGEVLEYYRARRLSVRRQPLLLELGSRVLRSYMYGLDLRTVAGGEEKEFVGLHRFALRLKAEPRLLRASEAR